MIVLTYQVNNLTEIIVKIHRLLFEAFNPLPLPRINAMYLNIVSSIIPETKKTTSVKHLIKDAQNGGLPPELPIPIDIYFNANQGQQFRLPLMPQIRSIQGVNKMHYIRFHWKPPIHSPLLLRCVTAKNDFCIAYPAPP